MMGGSGGRDRARSILVVMVVVLLPVRARAVAPYLYEVPLVALCVLFVASLRHGGLGRQGPLTGGVAVLWGLLVVALAAHPSVGGSLVVARLGAALVLAAVVSDGGPARLALVGWALAVSAAVQGALAVAQVVHGGPVGLAALGESRLPLYRVGSSLAPKGTFGHPYVLTAFCLLASVTAVVALDGSRRRPVLALASVAAVPVGMTYSRTAFVAVALIVAAVVAGARRARGPAVAPVAVLALLAGAAMAALVWNGGWVARTGTLSSGDLDTASSFRLTQVHSALRLARDHPFVGVGPHQGEGAGRADMARTRGGLGPVHDVPLLVTVEAGIPAGALTVILLAVLGYRSALAGVRALSLYLAFVPFVLLDHFCFTGAQGLTMAGIWLGLLWGLTAPPGPGCGVARSQGDCRRPDV